MKRAGFTLISLLVVIAILALLFGVSVPAVQKVREASARTQTVNNLKQVTLATHSCNDLNKKLPPATGWYGLIPRPKLKSAGDIPMTVHIYLQPFFESDGTYMRILNGTLVCANPPPTSKAWIGGMVWVPYLSPQDLTQVKKGAGCTNFAANLRVFSNVGFNTKWNEPIKHAKHGIDPNSGAPWYYGSTSIPRSFPDGTSNTMAFTTMYSVCGVDAPVTAFYNSAGKDKHSPFFGFHAPGAKATRDTDGPTKDEIFQVQPAQKNCNPSYTPQSFSTYGITVSMFDGSVHQVSPQIGTRSWGLAQQPNDGLPLGEDWNN